MCEPLHVFPADAADDHAVARFAVWIVELVDTGVAKHRQHTAGHMERFYRCGPESVTRTGDGGGKACASNAAYHNIIFSFIDELQIHSLLLTCAIAIEKLCQLLLKYRLLCREIRYQ